MPQLFMLTVPGLKVASDWAAVHDHLLDDFPGIIDVLATTMTATLLIVYEGDADVDAWLECIGEAILTRRLSGESAPRSRARSPARADLGTQSHTQSSPGISVRQPAVHRAWASSSRHQPDPKHYLTLNQST